MKDKYLLQTISWIGFIIAVFICYVYAMCATPTRMFPEYNHCAVTDCACTHGNDREWIVNTNEVGHITSIVCNQCYHEMRKSQ